jgi:hypothetical protein
MPWTVDDVEGFKSGLTARQKRQWVAVANSALASCIADDGSQSSCEASAIRQANGTVENNQSQAPDEVPMIIIQVNDYTIRTEQHEGRQHLVVPVIMMVEGVHSGSAGPLLHQGEDLGRYPASWDGIPVTIQHPQDGAGNPISANSPETIEQNRVGRVYHTRYSNGKLRAEAWLDEERLRQHSPQALGYIRQVRPLDVSIGVFTDDEPTSGEWQGEAYTAIARNHRPDHLALLPGGQGACSWADGCGVRTNQQGGDIAIDAKTIAEIKALTGKGHQVIQVDESASGGFRDIMHQIQSKLDGMDDDIKWHFLTETFDDTFIYEVQRRDTAASTLFRRSYSTNDDGVVEFEGEPEEVIRQVDFITVNEDGTKVTIISNGQAVAPDTNTNNEGGGTTMATACDVDKILQMNHLHWTDEDKDYLMTLSDERVQGILDTPEPDGATEGDDTPTGDAAQDGAAASAAPQMDEEAVKGIIKAQFATTEEALGLLPDEIQANIRQGLALNDQRRTELVTQVTTNSPSIYTEDELKAMKTPELEKLAQMANQNRPVDYSLAASGTILDNQDNDVLMPTGMGTTESN